MSVFTVSGGEHFLTYFILLYENIFVHLQKNKLKRNKIYD